MNRYTRIPYMVLRMIVYNNIMLITHNLNYFIKIVFDKNIYIIESDLKKLLLNTI